MKKPIGYDNIHHQKDDAPFMKPKKRQLHLRANELLLLPPKIFKEQYLRFPVFGEPEDIKKCHERAVKEGIVKKEK